MRRESAIPSGYPFRVLLTLNPLPHIDPVGSIFVPLVLSFTGGIMFGWSKPVPVHAGRLNRDVLKRAGLQLAWFDNNTGSKHQADRIPYFQLAESGDGPYCGEEGCFDEVLVEKMADFVKTMPEKDTLNQAISWSAETADGGLPLFS